MGMTSKQFQGLVRLTLAQLERALKESPDNKELQELRDISRTCRKMGIILQTARIYSGVSGKVLGWRSAVGLHCKFNRCAV